MSITSGNDENKQTLAGIAATVTDLVKKIEPGQVEGITPDLYELPPFVGKQWWMLLGDAIQVAERPTVNQIPGECWISLRCDGTGFSKFTKRMRRMGVFGDGFSTDFSDIMIACCRALLETFNGSRCAYTQSDEITVLIHPTSVVRGERQCHVYNGRIAKLTSLAAATVTARFNYELQRKVQSRGLDFEPQYLVTFDCRVGIYDTQEEAVSLLLWRAYDCGVNGVSDAVFHRKGSIEGAGKAVGLRTDQKLQWLAQHSLLPLHPHQKDGTYFVKRKRALQGVDRKTGEKTRYLRSRIEPVPGNLLWIRKRDALFPPDDNLEEH